MKKTICRKISLRIPSYDDSDFEGYCSEGGFYEGDILTDKVRDVISETEERYKQRGFLLKELDIIALLDDGGFKDRCDYIEYPIKDVEWNNIRSFLNGYADPGDISKVRIVLRFEN